ncbi:OmpL47-type beta-barrel domain-containing protein [Actinoallomurus iriomotensis]|nr:chitobiase/beta-hexosaminidase C-terminal domain-containing protein [Actinoallomurus iriomotensis]
MRPRPLPTLPARRRTPRALAAVAVAILSAMISALWLAPSAAAGAYDHKLHAAADQVLTWTADDSMTAYKSAPSTATAGPVTIVFDNSAASGNTTGMTHTLTFDTATAGYNHDVNLNIISSPYDANGGHHEVQANLTPGKYRYYCAMPGHQMSGELVVTAGGGTDTTPPQVSASVSGDKDADGNYVGSATVTVSASDTESGVATVEYALDGAPYAAYSAPVSVSDAGAHTVKYRATDKAGNTSPEGSVSFTVAPPPSGDTTPPQVSATVSGDKNADGTYAGSATVTVVASDTESGVAMVEYALDGQPFTAYANPVVVDQPGAHTVQFRATDKAGNTSSAGSVSFTVATPPGKDTTPPEVSASVSGDKDADGNYVGSATVTVSASDTESGVATVEYALDGAPYAAYSAPVSVNEAGAHTVKYRATDKAGNTSPEGSVSFTVAAPPSGDTTPPQVSVQATGDQDWAWNYVGSATVTISASDDDSGVATVEYALDGQPFTAYTKPFAVGQPGAHTVRFRATDKAGNTSDVGTAKFRVVKSGS